LEAEYHVLKRIARLIFRVIPLWSGRMVVYAGFAALVVVGGLILTLRYAVLPNIESYRGDIETMLTRSTGQRVSIGEITADWQGWRPQLSLSRVVIFDHAGRPALELARVDNALSWLSLLVFEPRFHHFRIHGPDLIVRRSPDGRLSVAGIEVKESTADGSLADWLLRQREVEITDAKVTWIDEARRAPELRLDKVNLRLQNDYFRHRFGLRAAAPAALAGPLDVRGDFSGKSVARLEQWEGQIYTQLDYVDLAAWKPWFDLPIELTQGRGAIRAWIDIAGARVTGAEADLQIADVKTKLAGDLDEVDLARLTGHLGWRDWKTGFEIFVKRLEAVAVGGHEFKSEEFRLRRALASANKPAHGEVRASLLDLAALSELARHLPVANELREELKRFAPRGKVSGLAGKWTGDWPPAQYELKARFEQLAVQAVDRIPGIEGFSGTLDANEKRGTLQLAGRSMRLELPRLFEEPVALQEAAARVTWTVANGRYDVRLDDVKFANEDAAGSLQGTYQTAVEGPGTIDLTASLTRADARRVYRYMPLMVGKPTRDWLRTAVVAGRSNDVKLRLKGNLARFPFEQPGQGIFEVTAKAQDGIVAYASGWPRLENVVADLAFAGVRMELRATGGNILGTPLGRVQAVIPDLAHKSEVLEVSGEAEAPTSEFLRFVGESPVAGMIERFTDGMEAQGHGKLTLKLALPLRRMQESKVSGAYQFRGNRLRVDPDLPPLEQVDGRIEFTEASVRGQGITAQIFGGPATIAVSTQEGGVSVAASGRANLDAVRRLTDHPFMQQLSGAADWRSSVRVRAKLAEFTIESGLVGVASTLPYPLAKTANESLPVRFERRVNGSQQDQMDIALGKLVNVRMLRRRDTPQPAIDRVAVGFGTEPPAAEGPGVWVRGSLPTLDVDRWRELMDGAPAAGAPLPALAGVDLKLGSMDLFSRRFNDVAIAARSQTGDWRARVSARELVGEIGWRPQGKGQIVARLQRLVLPQPIPRVGAVPATQSEAQTEYPALDVVIEEFQHNARAWGRLQLEATPDGRNWKIDKLQLKSAESTLTADGTWQWQARVPRTQVNYRLEIGDIGRFLARMNYPEGVKGGTATLSGTLGWNGGPQDLDLPSLTGSIGVEAHRGQFTKLEPGIGKLLGILNLQSLPRRVTLDFKDVFSEGFAFDSIAGRAKVERGVATTEGLRIVGTSAVVLMSGEVDLVHETQKLKVRVTPAVGDSVAAVTALLGGPVAGLGVLLAQRLLKDPLGQLIAYDYSVSGTWSDPAVVRIQTERAEPS